MKILLLSDSHGNIFNIHRAIDKNMDVDIIIHLGDCIKDILQVKESYQGKNFEFVAGNNDWAAESFKEKVVDMAGVKVMLAHGHIYNVKFSYNSLISKAKLIGADAVFFGHTHRAEELYTENILLLNPGTIGSSTQSDRPTYCIVNIIEGKIKVKFQSVI
ncbi:MAG: metallophosphoesterase [Bacteroidota bacterium]|nr:metallophosphoesterase [Bacteroidota bacterium]